MKWFTNNPKNILWYTILNKIFFEGKYRLVRKCRCKKLSQWKTVVIGIYWVGNCHLGKFRVGNCLLRNCQVGYCRVGNRQVGSCHVGNYCSKNVAWDIVMVWNCCVGIVLDSQKRASCDSLGERSNIKWLGVIISSVVSVSIEPRKFQ